MDVERAEGGGTGSARRRRERRLRSMLRHERMAVAMALAEALHRSSGLRVMERAQHAAPRGQETGTRAGEEVEYMTLAGLPAQKTPPPRERPGILPEPEPQRSDRTVRRFAGDALPQLATPSLAGAAGETVDAGTVAFLTRAALEAQEEEARRVQLAQVKAAKKEWRGRRQELVDELDVWRAVLPSQRTPSIERRISEELVSTLEASSSSKPPTRKRKKRRRKRTRRIPLGPLPLLCRAGLRDGLWRPCS